jgi:hypothetical protein
MSIHSIDYDEVKRRIRKLKKLEIKIRFGSNSLTDKSHSADLVWDTFFDLHETYAGKAKYSIQKVSVMDKEEYRNVIDEFFFHVYCRLYKENGIINIQIFDPGILSHILTQGAMPQSLLYYWNTTGN